MSFKKGDYIIYYKNRDILARTNVKQDVCMASQDAWACHLKVPLYTGACNSQGPSPKSNPKTFSDALKFKGKTDTVTTNNYFGKKYFKWNFTIIEVRGRNNLMLEIKNHLKLFRKGY